MAARPGCPVMFDGFDTVQVDVGGTTIFARRKGDGRPLLLLHGFPETHVMWHRVAPALARQFTVVCADLRGYGASGKPASTPDHAPYGKSAMAIDMVRLLEDLGFPHFLGRRPRPRRAGRLSPGAGPSGPRRAPGPSLRHPDREPSAARHSLRAGLLAVVTARATRAAARTADRGGARRRRQRRARQLGIGPRVLSAGGAVGLFRRAQRPRSDPRHLRGVSGRRRHRFRTGRSRSRRQQMHLLSDARPVEQGKRPRQLV